MKQHFKTLSLFIAVFMIFTHANPSAMFAQSQETSDLSSLYANEKAVEALDESIYIHTMSKTAHVDRELALTYYDFTAEELDAVQNELNLLTEAQIDQLIQHSMENSETGVELRSATLIMWVGIAAIVAIVASTALYFSATYMNHQQKLQLIEGCYDVGGTPIIDSGDKGEITGEPEKAWWKITSTYTFKCAI